MKRFLTILYSSFIALGTFAQQGGEAKLPLYQNFELLQHAKQYPEAEKKTIFQTALGKQGIADSSFPFIDHFTNTGSVLSDKNWQDGNVKKVGHTAIFDALNKLGNPYTGPFGGADTLVSQSIKLTAFTNLYVELNYSTGSTWSAGDSLLLEFQTSSGSWQTVWHSLTTAVTKRTVGLLIDPTLFDPYNVKIRLINYTAFNAGNTEDFILNYIVFARKWDLPIYENLTAFSKDSFPSKEYWTKAQTTISQGSTYGINWGNVAIFDAFDENKSVYNNANGQVGFADTLTSHFMDLTTYDVADSVYMRFFYRAMPNSKPTDSLIVEFKNNVGVWSRVASLSGAPFSNLKTFIQLVNIGKFRSPSFQFRVINKCTYVASDTLKWITTGFHIGRKLVLPFVDDFSTSSIYPNQSLWTDKLVYINNSFPLHPPSFNVATFDGLDRFGNPYGAGHSYCDSLTSLPINLSDISLSDTTVYLSFFIEPMGLGDYPNMGDSLIVEMRNAPYNPASFTTTWSTVASLHKTDSFSQILIRIDSTYFHDDFQFRFKNIGSRTGNLHHWHVDYVRLEKGLESYYNDVAISSSSSGLLKKYSSMPWNHFDPTIHQIDTQFLSFKNNYKDRALIDYKREIFNQQPVLLDLFTNSEPKVEPESEVTVGIGKPVILTPFIVGDTISFTTQFTGKVGAAFDNIPSNNTYSVQTHFSNYFAYDDGSAEAGYSVKNQPGSVALGYTLSMPDTLFGISVFFNQSTTDITGQPFNFMVWKEVGQSSPTGETVIRRFFPYATPVYQNKINGFYYFKFPEPIGVDGKFYIGWEQTQKFELNIGFDQNYKIDNEYAPNPEMYYKTSDLLIWQQTQLAGALMMRPIVGKWIDPPVGVKEVTATSKEHILVYPNPANNYLHINANHEGALSVELFDLTGKLVLKEELVQSQMALPPLTNGMYILKIRNTHMGTHTVKKLMINQE